MPTRKLQENDPKYAQKRQRQLQNVKKRRKSRKKRLAVAPKARRQSLYRARRKKRLYQREVAAKVGVLRQHYTQIEDGNARPSFKLAAKLAKVLDTPIETLFPDVFYHYAPFWDDFYRFHGYSEAEIIQAHKKHAKYRLTHPRKRPRGAKKSTWDPWRL